jgi:hypothetical protein
MLPESSKDQTRIVRAPEDGRAPPASPAIVGYIDKIEGNKVSGWAWDRNRPDVAVDVDIHIAGKPITTVRADRLRKDLARSGTGNGFHAFEAVLDKPVSEADRALVGAVARVDGHPGAIALANRAADPNATADISNPAAPPPELQRWLNDLAVVRAAFEQTLKIAAEDIREAVRGRNQTPVGGAVVEVASPDAIEELRARQDELSKQLAALEVFHTRFDTVLRTLERPQVELERREDSGKGLRLAVVIVGMLSGLSLLVGIYSVLH